MGGTQNVTGNAQGAIIELCRGLTLVEKGLSMYAREMRSRNAALFAKIVALVRLQLEAEFGIGRGE